MRITKYPQSCLMVDKGDGALLIDPGDLAMAMFGDRLLHEAAGILFTHSHPDHLDPGSVGRFEGAESSLHGNADVAESFSAGAVEVVVDGDEFVKCGFEITAHELAHFPGIDGTAGPPNLGFEIDYRLLHPGDSLEIPESLRPAALALPIAGPSVSFRDAYSMVVRADSVRIIPIHYDYYLADPQRFRSKCAVADVIVLGDGESITL